MKIDFDVLNDLAQFQALCDQLNREHQGPDCEIIWNKKIDIPEYKLNPDVYFEYGEKKNDFPGSETKSFFREDQPKDAVLDRHILKEDDPTKKRFEQELGLKHSRMMMNVQKQGKHIPPHSDRGKSFLLECREKGLTDDLEWLQIKRYIYFLEDRQVGQFFQVGNTQLDWKAGDMCQFPMFKVHTTANAGPHTRHVLAITGV
jgi:hypothetical protein